MRIRTAMIPELTISKYSRMRDVVDHNPPYQREGGIWGVATRTRLIDSILNGLDVPKLYFEKAATRRLTPEGLTYQYAVIDGKQRLEAISSFLAGQLRLAAEFRFYEDETVKAAGMTLEELESQYPRLAQRFLDYELPVVSVTSDSGDLIEEMFQRLNASSALNAAELRNAISGATRDAANQLAEHDLLVSRSPVKNARYKYRELGAKFLVIEHQLDTKGRVSDTKAETLRRLFLATNGNSPSIAAETMLAYQVLAERTLDRLSSVFGENDPLLASIGTVVVYYIVFRDDDVVDVDRAKLQEFEELRREASRMAEDDEAYARPANARLREYNVLVQSTNDGKALERRAAMLSAFLKAYNQEDPLLGLDGLGDGVDVPDDFEVDD
jgi:hypothetical protein